MCANNQGVRGSRPQRTRPLRMQVFLTSSLRLFLSLFFKWSKITRTQTNTWSMQFSNVQILHILYPRFVIPLFPFFSMYSDLKVFLLQFLRKKIFFLNGLPSLSDPATLKRLFFGFPIYYVFDIFATARFPIYIRFHNLVVFKFLCW